MARFGTARENSVIAGLYVLIPGDGVLLPLRNMAPLIKDSVEIANSTPAAPTTQASVAPKPAAAGGTLRADALSLEVPVKVHGSRVSDAARGAAPHTEPFEEETGTMIVFPHGGVLRMSTAVTVSQMLVVTNLKTRQDAICRVVKVRTFSNMQGYVEVEFTHQQPGYWGVHFPSEGPAPAPVSETAPVISTANPVAVPEAPVKTAPAQNVSAPVAPAAPVSSGAPAPTPVAPPAVVAPPPVEPVVPFTPVAFNPPPPPPPVIPVAPSKPEPAFISLGTQEKVQPAASSTSTAPVEHPAPVSRVAPPASRPESVLSAFTSAPLSEPLGTSVPTNALPGTPVDFPAAPPAATPASLTTTELRGDQRGTAVVPPAETSDASAEHHAAEVAEAPAQSSRAVFGSFSNAASLSGSHGVAVDAFGARLDGGSEAVAEHAGAARSSNWMLIAACMTLLFATVVGGVLYFRPHATNNARNAANNSNTPAIPQPLAFQTPAAVPDSGTPDAAAPLHNSATHPVPVIAQAPGLTPAIVANTNDANGDGPRIVPKPASNLAPGMVKNAGEDHPVAPQRGDADQAEQAPSVDAAPAGDSANTGALSGIVSDNVAAPEAPKIQQEGPVKVGGNVKEPRLITRVMPEYPVVAKQAGIQGDVVVQTTIDPKGNVVDMKVVSGPAMLRGPALAALRRWKYEPSTLNGQPIAVEMSVTIKFSGNH
jgi:TonB family protein